MNILQKIEKLNKACNHSLSFTHYVTGWTINSYLDNTPLHMTNKYPFFIAKEFEKVVNLAYEFVFGKK